MCEHLNRLQANKALKKSPLSVREGMGGVIQLPVLRTRPPRTGVKIPETGKRGFRGQKAPISQCLKKRAL